MEQSSRGSILSWGGKCLGDTLLLEKRKALSYFSQFGGRGRLAEERDTDGSVFPGGDTAKSFHREILAWDTGLSKPRGETDRTLYWG